MFFIIYQINSNLSWNKLNITTTPSNNVTVHTCDCYQKGKDIKITLRISTTSTKATGEQLFKINGLPPLLAYFFTAASNQDNTCSCVQINPDGTIHAAGTYTKSGLSWISTTVDCIAK